MMDLRPETQSSEMLGYAIIHHWGHLSWPLAGMAKTKETDYFQRTGEVKSVRL